LSVCYDKVEMDPDLTRPDPSILLICSKEEADPSFTRVPEETFFDTKGKTNFFFIFRGNFPNPDQNQRWVTRTGLGQKFLTQSHH